MTRPAGYQWEPLGWDTDPVPGDPQVISAEAAHLTQVANEITSQVTALRHISADGVQIGQSPAAIRSAASTLAGDSGDEFAESWSAFLTRSCPPSGGPGPTRKPRSRRR